VVTGLLGAVLRARREGRLGAALRARAAVALAAARYTVHDPAARRVRLDAPSYVQPSDDPAERRIVERIFAAFRRMKADQRSAPAVYLPAPQWQRQLDEAYEPFGRALARDDIAPFHFFLANFGAWERYTGVESTTLIREAARSRARRLQVTNETFLQALELWRWLRGPDADVRRLSYPRFGNQAGAHIDGTFVGPGSFFNDVYGSLLAGLVSDRERPVVADLGAGYGKLAYFILRDLRRWTFIDLDLPETLCLAAYYLMKAWPDRAAVLYGEAGDSEPSAHDLVFLPAYAIDRIPDRAVDLFVNKNSLGEMTADAARVFVGHIARTTRWFFHLNHDVLRNRYSDGSSGLLGREYPVPADRFRLLMRYPDLGHLARGGRIDTGNDIFMYLYERR